ncbi:MAG: ATP synthase F0 subunit C [Candidatus Magnetoovum sp. WYHC-5]|nr:ATP synthase F0 subunit C [Candidatus Magnetoovum sp. WYHC-5]
MKKTLIMVFLMVAVICLGASIAMASEAAAQAGAPESSTQVKAIVALSAALSIGLAALGTGIGMGLGLSKACEGVARNPGVSGKIMTILLVGLALIESLAIYAFLISLSVLTNQQMFF